MNSLIISKIEPKQFYRKLELLFSELGAAGSVRRFAAQFAQEFCKHFAEQLDIRSLIALDLLNDEPEMLYQWGAINYPIDEAFISEFHGSDLPWVGEWNGSATAVFSIGEQAEILICVSMQRPVTSDYATFWSHIYSLFSSVHYTLGQFLRRLELEDAFDQARAIQMSLLPSPEIKFDRFEIAAATTPAQSVGGDVFDFQLLSHDKLSIVLGDAAGHGLPAALQARDLMIGLRMGFELEQDIAKIAAKLNHVIHRSGLVSRFASTFLATLHNSGLLTFVNAGHPRPLLLNSDGFQELNPSSMILGPNPDTVYSASNVFLDPGSMLVLVTDGLLEHSNIHGIEFGQQELKRWMLDWQNQNASAAVHDLFERLNQYGNGRPFRDDASAVVAVCRQ
jgi:hypothetical protein